MLLVCPAFLPLGNHLSLHFIVTVFVLCGMQNNSPPEISVSQSLGPVNMLDYVAKGG